jgi:hypothetical protein
MMFSRDIIDSRTLSIGELRSLTKEFGNFFIREGSDSGFEILMKSVIMRGRKFVMGESERELINYQRAWTRAQAFNSIWSIFSAGSSKSNVSVKTKNEYSDNAHLIFWKSRVVERGFGVD